MKSTTKNAARKAQLAVIRRDDHDGLLAHFAQCPELFSPMLNLIASGKQTIDSVMNQAGRVVLELLLQLSASSIAGDKSPGRQSGEVLWHGSNFVVRQVEDYSGFGRGFIVAVATSIDAINSPAVPDPTGTYAAGRA